MSSLLAETSAQAKDQISNFLSHAQASFHLGRFSHLHQTILSFYAPTSIWEVDVSLPCGTMPEQIQLCRCALLALHDKITPNLFTLVNQWFQQAAPYWTRLSKLILSRDLAECSIEERNSIHDSLTEIDRCSIQSMMDMLYLENKKLSKLLGWYKLGAWLSELDSKYVTNILNSIDDHTVDPFVLLRILHEIPPDERSQIAILQHFDKVVGKMLRKNAKQVIESRLIYKRFQDDRGDGKLSRDLASWMPPPLNMRDFVAHIEHAVLDYFIAKTSNNSLDIWRAFTPRKPLKIMWRAAKRQLQINGQTVKNFREDANNLMAILQAFEDDGWIDTIGYPKGMLTRQIKDAVAQLNKIEGVAKHLFFSFKSSSSTVSCQKKP